MDTEAPAPSSAAPATASVGSLLPPLPAPLLAPQLCHRSPLPPAQPRQLGLLTLLTPSRGLPANISVYNLSPYWCGMSTASQKSGQPSETWQYITKFDIVMLTETQSPALFGRHLSGYTVCTIPATSLDRAGEGVLLAVRRQLPFSVSHWQTDQANSTIWLTLKPAQSRQQPLTVGVCKNPP